VGGFLILEYQKSSAPHRACLASRIGVQAVSNKTPLEPRMLVFKNIAKHPTISAVTGMGGHRFLVPQYEGTAHASHSAAHTT
jgi:hypothetical protein